MFLLPKLLLDSKNTLSDMTKQQRSTEAPEAEMPALPDATSADGKEEKEPAQTVPEISEGDKTRIAALLDLAEGVLGHFSSIGNVAYYTMLNGLFCINVWLFLKVYYMVF